MPETKKRILFIDDERPFRMLSRINLEAAGYHVDSAASGREAIACVEKQRFDLIILDLLMPQPDGFKVFQKFKELKIMNQTPVLLLTVLGLESQVQQLISDGAHHLKKEEAPEQLLPMVKELIG
jgi:CheY-like chemotaxis protein